MSSNPSRPTMEYDPLERAREKQLSREKDEEDLKSGAKTQEQLCQENCWFRGLKFRINFEGAKKLG